MHVCMTTNILHRYSMMPQDLMSKWKLDVWIKQI